MILKWSYFLIAALLAAAFALPELDDPLEDEVTIVVGASRLPGYIDRTLVALRTWVQQVKHSKIVFVGAGTTEQVRKQIIDCIDAGELGNARETEDVRKNILACGNAPILGPPPTKTERMNLLKWFDDAVSPSNNKLFFLESEESACAVKNTAYGGLCCKMLTGFEKAVEIQKIQNNSEIQNARKKRSWIAMAVDDTYVHEPGLLRELKKRFGWWSTSQGWSTSQQEDVNNSFKNNSFKKYLGQLSIRWAGYDRYMKPIPDDGWNFNRHAGGGGGFVLSTELVRELVDPTPINSSSDSSILTEFRNLCAASPGNDQAVGKFLRERLNTTLTHSPKFIQEPRYRDIRIERDNGNPNHREQDDGLLKGGRNCSDVFARSGRNLPTHVWAANLDWGNPKPLESMRLTDYAMIHSAVDIWPRLARLMKMDEDMRLSRSDMRSSRLSSLSSYGLGLYSYLDIVDVNVNGKAVIGQRYDGISELTLCRNG